MPRRGARRRNVSKSSAYKVLLVTEHLTPQLAPIPALMALAYATTMLRVGSFVFANDFRNPVVLAKEAATVDVLSGGRLEFGLGAGWSTPDDGALGIPYDRPKVRVARMAEGLRLIKAIPEKVMEPFAPLARELATL